MQQYIVLKEKLKISQKDISLCSHQMKFRKKNKILPINTEKKNICTGMLSIGDDTFKNQFGDIGKNLRNKRKKKRLS